MRVLIIGAAGMLGHKLWQRLPSRFPDTWATLRKPKAYYREHGLFDSEKVIDGLDVSDFSAVERVLGDLRPNVIVNCVAITKRHEDKSDPTETIQLNALLPHQLARWCTNHGSRLIHFSTDCVFDGTVGGYTEDSKQTAYDIYGRSKALGETHGKNTLTIRTSFIGREIVGGTELVEWFLSQKGKRVRGFRQALYTGVTTPVAADVVAEVIARFPDLSGVYQVASQTIDKFDLLNKLNAAFDNGCQIDADDSFVCKRNLIGKRFTETTGIVIPSWDEMIRGMASDPTPYHQWRKLK